MGAPADKLWSTPKFFLIVLLVDAALMFTLNGVLNEVLHLGVSPSAIAIAPAIVLVALLPRWRVFANRVARKPS
jgi:hypothetical protein